MAYLSITEVLNKKYITDTSIACALAKGELTLDDEVVKHHIYQVGAYQAVYNVGEKAEEVVDDPATSDVNEHEQAVADAKAAAEAAKAADAEMIKDLTKSDEDASNDIKFTVDGSEKTYEGDPTAAMKVALTSLELDPTTLYIDEAKETKLVVKSKKAADLAGLVLYTKTTEVTE